MSLDSIFGPMSTLYSSMSNLDGVGLDHLSQNLARAHLEMVKLANQANHANCESTHSTVNPPCSSLTILIIRGSG